MKINLRKALLEARYEIRRKVAVANIEAGITDMLASAACHTDFIATLTTLAGTAPTPDEAVLLGRHAALNVPTTERGYTTPDHITVGAVEATAIQKFKDEIADITRHKQKTQDSLLEANIRTNIEISVTCEGALKAAKLL